MFICLSDPILGLCVAKRHDVVQMKESGVRKSTRRRIQLSAADMHAYLNLENETADKYDMVHHRP